MISVSLPFDNTSVAYYKHDERGRAEMCKEVEEYAKDYAKEYAKEYAEEYAKEYRKQAEEAKENEAKARENEAKAKENEAKMKQKFDNMIKNAVRKKKDQDMTNKEIRTFLMDTYDLSEEEADAYIKGVQ